MSVRNRPELERALGAVDAGLADAPRSLDLQAERAMLLAALGRTDAARAAYLEVLGQDANHFAALINFGAMLYETGFRTAARTLFGRAVEVHPYEPLAHVNLANVLMYAEEADAARAHYETALRLDPACVQAHQRLSELLREARETDAARRHRRLGFGAAPVGALPCLGDGEPLSLLLLCSTPAGDIAWRKLIDDQVFATTTLVAEFHDPSAPLPPHQLVFNAIGDADVSRADLLAAEALLATSHAPVLNHPTKVLPTGRAENAARLAALPGVRAPRTVHVSREALEAGDASRHGLAFPLLLRSPGFHTGRHFVRVEDQDALRAALADLPGRELMAIEPLDARAADGRFRKYRVMMIGGELYPLHMAVSSDWKVHYFSAEMSGHAAFQAEEARFLTDMADALGPTAMGALRAIQATLGLDYGGVDFGLDLDGQLLLFEANAVMNIVPPDASPQWDYRRPAIARATQAARTLLVERARRASTPDFQMV